MKLRKFSHFLNYMRKMKYLYFVLGNNLLNIKQK